MSRTPRLVFTCMEMPLSFLRDDPPAQPGPGPEPTRPALPNRLGAGDDQVRRVFVLHWEGVALQSEQLYGSSS